VQAVERIAGHGSAVPRGQSPGGAPLPLTGRFGKLFPDRPECRASDAAIDALVEQMRRPDATPANSRIPAGFTYLGQFVDHDITFDPTSKLDRSIDPHALVNFRTPRLDLDSVYAGGPLAQPYLYDWRASDPPGVRLLVGFNPVEETVDLPRNQQGRALIGDARNDENVLLAQLHLLFVRFHNAVVDRLLDQGAVPRDELFEHAQRLVRWHYQWIVLTEFLPLVAGEATARAVLPAGPGEPPAVERRHFDWDGEPFIPVEFSGAAYRFGHSMVREQYGLARLPDRGPARRARTILPDLGGFRPLPRELVVDWERFFRLGADAHQAQPSQRISTSIAGPLFALPVGDRELPRRNLRRAHTLRLTSGQEVADAMEEAPLDAQALHLDELPAAVRGELGRATPLWYYLLCEAEREPAAGRHLGPLGGRIVAEVLAGLVEADSTSYLNAGAPWSPTELGTGGSFTMSDLIAIAQRR
jgi:hypothetical protein